MVEIPKFLNFSLFVMERDDSITLKITVIGEYFVGKTSIIGRFVDGTFDESYSATIGFSFLSKTVSHEGTSYVLNIWDTSGSERHRAVAPNYYHGTDGCILVYDVSNPQSLQPLSYWYEEFESLASSGRSNESIPTLLLGNKADLPHEQSTVEEAELFCQTHNISKHFVVSALDGRNVEPAFNELVSLCSKHQQLDFNSVILKASPKAHEEQQKKCC